MRLGGAARGCWAVCRQGEHALPYLPALLSIRRSSRGRAWRLGSARRLRLIVLGRTRPRSAVAGRFQALRGTCHIEPRSCAVRAATFLGASVVLVGRAAWPVASRHLCSQAMILIGPNWSFWLSLELCSTFASAVGPAGDRSGCGSCFATRLSSSSAGQREKRFLITAIVFLVDFRPGCFTAQRRRHWPEADVPANFISIAAGLPRSSRPVRKLATARCAH